jgi:hypothetical protein
MGLIVRVNEAIGRHRNNHCKKEQLDLPPVIHAKGDGSEAKIGTKPQSLHSTTSRVACIHMGRVWFLFFFRWMSSLYLIQHSNSSSYIARSYKSIDKLKSEISAITTHDNSSTN